MRGYDDGVRPSAAGSLARRHRRRLSTGSAAPTCVIDRRGVKVALPATHARSSPYSTLSRRAATAPAPLYGLIESPALNERCIRTVSTHRPSLKPTDLNVPTGSNPRRRCSAMEDALPL